VELVNNSYYQLIIKGHVFFTIDHLKQFVDIQKQLGEQKLPVLVITNIGSDTDIEFLHDLAKKETQPYTLATAFVLKSLPQKILASMYLKIIKPQIPTRFFKSEKEALTWLYQEFKVKP